MTTRTTTMTVTFTQPVILGDLDEVLPPGTYEVETDEELLEGLSFDAYRRVLTLIHLPAKSGHRGSSRTLTIDPKVLDAALERDAASAKASSQQMPTPSASTGALENREAKTDRQGVDRAEDEGMLVLRR